MANPWRRARRNQVTGQLRESDVRLCTRYAVKLDPLPNAVRGGTVTATWCALCTTMLLTTALIFFIVKNTSKAWDYATTIACVHGVASMLGA
jgi:hypothetical protein